MRSVGRATSLSALTRHLRAFTEWATVDPTKLSGREPGTAANLVGGEWGQPSKRRSVIDPWNGEDFISLPDPQVSEIGPYVESLKKVPKSGLHNPFKNPERYNLYGDISNDAAAELLKPATTDFFAKLIQRTSPKSYAQAMAEVTVTGRFLQNFAGDSVRWMARSFAVSGDHAGQMSNGMRWPFGPVALITPFNFPLEIPALQLMGALFMGNKPLVHVDHRVSIVAEQFLRLLHHVGMPREDADLIHGDGRVVNQILLQARPRSTLFTGSGRVAEQLAHDLDGKVFLEDAGFDWKILGPDVGHIEYVAWQCDQDAYACSGQKCSAQSLLFMHANWARAGLLNRLAQRAGARNMEDQTVGPVLTWSTRALLEHVEELASLPGASVAFGGRPLEGHSIPEKYGAIHPTAVFVPLKQILQPKNFELVTTEVFGPVQVITEYEDADIEDVLAITERMNAHLTAAVVSNDILFLNKVLANTVNGTTYAGLRARTTGAPQNHWFGPAGDPRSAGIGTPEAIRLVWSCHREVVNDYGPPPSHPSTLQTT